MHKKKISQLKDDYVAYFQDVPIQKYAAMFIGRDEDTILRWRKEDTVFADAVQKAEAEFIRKKMIAVKAEFALERLFKHAFSYKEEVVLTPENPQHPQSNNTANLRDKFKQFMLEETKARPPTSVVK